MLVLCGNEIISFNFRDFFFWFFSALIHVPFADVATRAIFTAHCTPRDNFPNRIALPGASGDVKNMRNVKFGSVDEM